MSRATRVLAVCAIGMMPGWVAAAEPHIQSHDPQQIHWLLRDASLPANVADVLESFPSAGAMWLSAPTQGVLLTGATDDESTVFYHGDHLGSSNVMTDQNGILLQEVAYFPFGEVRTSHETGLSARDPYGYTQKEQDSESDLHYFEARYLASGLSRFLTPDPKFVNPAKLSSDDLGLFLSQPQKLNAYSYVLNNPMKYTDPTGLDENERPSPGEQIGHGAKKIVNSWKDGVLQSFDTTFMSVWESDAPDAAKIGYAIISPIPIFAGSLVYSGANMVEGVMHIGTGAGRAAMDGAVWSVGLFQSVDNDALPANYPKAEHTSDPLRRTQTSNESPPPPPGGPQDIRIPRRSTLQRPKATPSAPSVAPGPYQGHPREPDERGASRLPH